MSISMFDYIIRIPTREALNAELEAAAARWGDSGLDFSQFRDAWLRAHSPLRKEGLIG